MSKKVSKTTNEGNNDNLLLFVRARWTDEEVKMIKENWWWTPDLAAYYIPAKTGIQRSVKSFARKQKEILGRVPTNDYVDY
jgi:hypothetical protein